MFPLIAKASWRSREAGFTTTDLEKTRLPQSSQRRSDSLMILILSICRPRRGVKLNGTIAWKTPLLRCMMSLRLDLLRWVWTAIKSSRDAMSGINQKLRRKMFIHFPPRKECNLLSMEASVRSSWKRRKQTCRFRHRATITNLARLSLKTDPTRAHPEMTEKQHWKGGSNSSFLKQG